jgi:hypothetical protein
MKSVWRTIERIHASGHQLVLEFAGAGSLGLAWLHAVPGSSRTILEATDRYCAASLSELLGGTPETFVNPKTAIAMANAAYLRACRLGDQNHPRLGVACTATIATDRVKRGKHRCCIAIRDGRSVRSVDLVLTKGLRDRQGEEFLVASLLVKGIADAVGARGTLPVNLAPGEHVKVAEKAFPDPIESLWKGKTRWVVIEPDGTRRPEGKVRGLVYCGAFNPLHFGHEALAAAARLPVTFELSALNVEKSELNRPELERRLAQFHGRHRIVVTRAPLFAQKARLFPGCTFLMGFDTAARLVDARFYGGSKSTRDRALAAIGTARCRILVAGRLHDGLFQTLDDIRIPAGAGKLFCKLPEFRADVSATALREAQCRNQ